MCLRVSHGTKGLLFYADDLHWADRGTLWLLGHLLRQLRTERVLILGAYRETELDRAHPLAKSLVDWNRERLDDPHRAQAFRCRRKHLINLKR